MKKKSAKGFTIIEILVVIAIIGILSSVVLANLRTAKEKARIAIAHADLKSIATGIVLLANDTSEWPGHNAVDVVDTGASGNEVWDLGSPEAGLAQTDGLYIDWNGPYIRAASTTDPWGNNYFFDSDYNIGTSTDIWVTVIGSFGPNGVGQNVYDADNIIRILAATSS